MNRLGQEKDKRMEDTIIKDMSNRFKLKKIKDTKRKQMTPQIKI